VFLAVVGAATILHVIKQQVGVGKGLCRLSSWIYDAWGWTMIAFGSLLYYSIYSDLDFSAATRAWVDSVLVALAALTFVLTVVCHLRIKTALGRFYLWANALMVLQSGLFYAEGYAFLAILGPRLVHDLTAFTFYVAHDVNRHGQQARPGHLLGVPGVRGAADVPDRRIRQPAGEPGGDTAARPRLAVRRELSDRRLSGVVALLHRGLHLAAGLAVSPACGDDGLKRALTACASSCTKTLRAGRRARRRGI
jgi:hypothetical protein